MDKEKYIIKYAGKSLDWHKKKTQEACNAYIRQRDQFEPCISCGEGRSDQAGHFYTVKMYDQLRYNELNIHGQCSKCNLDSMNQQHVGSMYRKNIVSRIGQDGLDRLDEMAAEVKRTNNKWTKIELIDILYEYKDKIRS